MSIRIFTYCCLVVLFGLSWASNLFAQAGVSSLSVGAAKAGVQLRFDDIRVEEFVNYHRHKLPLPSYDERIHLDTRWGRLPSGKIAVQVGLTTHRDISPEHMTPLNLVLVIDRSGSMQGDRIKNVKRSLLSFTERLRETDLVTIVSFSTTATVNLPACHKTDRERIEKAIRTIEANGSTNLHGGLMLGYQEAVKRFDPERANRVILLTDGIANVGTTAPDQIARESKSFNSKGIDLTTIGLGSNFNEQLLRTLAEAGRGAVHFVGDCKDIQKTFVDELDSLLSPSARQIEVKIDFGNAANVARFYGYDPVKSGSKYKFKVDNMSHGATQVILAELKTLPVDSKIKVHLDFVDCLTNKSVSQKKKFRLGGIESAAELTDPSLRKNVSIAKVAYAIKQSAKLVENHKFNKSQKKLASAISFARSYFEQGCDADVDRVVEIASDRYKLLTEAHKRQVALKRD